MGSAGAPSPPLRQQQQLGDLVGCRWPKLRRHFPADPAPPLPPTTIDHRASLFRCCLSADTRCARGCRQSCLLLLSGGCLGAEPPLTPAAASQERIEAPSRARQRREQGADGRSRCVGSMQLCRGRALGISVAVAHGVFSGSLNILLKFLLNRYHFIFLTVLQCLTSSTAALSLEVLRRRGALEMPPFSFSLGRAFAGATVLSTLQSSLTLWSLRGLSLPMYVVFKRCLPLVTLLIGVLVLKNGVPSLGVSVAVLITTCGAALAGECEPQEEAPRGLLLAPGIS